MNNNLRKKSKSPRRKKSKSPRRKSSQYRKFSKARPKSRPKPRPKSKPKPKSKPVSKPKSNSIYNLTSSRTMTGSNAALISLLKDLRGTKGCKIYDKPNIFIKLRINNDGSEEYIKRYGRCSCECPQIVRRIYCPDDPPCPGD